MGRRRWFTGLIWGLLLGCLAFVGLGAFGDLEHMGGVLSHFRWEFGWAALGLALVNYLLRFARWEIYLRAADARVPLGQSLLVFLSGLAFSVSPGKAGELVKAYLLRTSGGIEVRRTAPVVLMERVTDLLGVLLLVAWGGLRFGSASTSGSLLVVGLVALAGLGFAPAAPGWLGRLVPRWKGALADAEVVLRRLLAPGTMLPSLALATGAWFAECVGFALIVQGLGATLDLSAASFVYATATLAGAITFLPGGLIGTETSLVAALALLGLGRPQAAAATLLIRLATLWFAVALGIVALLAWTRSWGRPPEPAPPDTEGSAP